MSKSVSVPEVLVFFQISISKSRYGPVENSDAALYFERMSHIEGLLYE